MAKGKPSQVKLSVALLYLALVLVLIQSFATAFSWGRPPTALIAINGIVAILTVFLIEYISIGRNWARIFYFVLTLLGLPVSFAFFRQHLSDHAYLMLLSLSIQLIAHGFAFYLLFFSPGKRWFKPQGARA